VVEEDNFNIPTTIAGTDCAFTKDSIICAAVLLDYITMDFIERAYVVRKLDFPYIPTFLSYREGKATAAAILELDTIPDIVMFDGCGINHPRKVGLASHIGVVMDIPTIGIAKKILCGSAHSPQLDEAEPLIFKNEQIGWLMKTTKRSNPIVIAPGHRVSMDSALEITRHCLAGHKLPEPTRLAHLYVNEVKKESMKNE
jgi:deoxyribonuclease V